MLAKFSHATGPKLPAVRSPLASRTARCLLILSLLLATLAPAMSQALAAVRGDVAAWSQICRSSLVSPRAGASLLANKAAAEKESLHGLFEHCPYCGLHAQDLAPPPAAVPVALRLSLRHELPERFFSAAVTAHAWAPALARGPPTRA